MKVSGIACVKDFSINLLTDITLDKLLVEPQNSEEAELNFMVICLPISIFHGSSFAVFALNQDGERNREKVY